MRWARRSDLRDVQLGVAIAALLPPELAPRWLPLLERWRVAHAARDPPVDGCCGTLLTARPWDQRAVGFEITTRGERLPPAG
jgi:hypothetical protein